MHFLIFGAILFCLAYFRPLRKFIFWAACLLVVFILPGATDDPGLTWALIFALIGFCALVFAVVWALDQGKKHRDFVASNAAAPTLRQTVKEERKSTFGKFRPRG